MQILLANAKIMYEKAEKKPSNPQLSRTRRFCQEKKESIEAREAKHRL